MNATKRKLEFRSVDGISGVRKAEYRPAGSKDELTILQLRRNVFHVIARDSTGDSGETIVINNPTAKKSPGEILFDLLLDYLSTPKKGCYTITIITQWPNGTTEIESESHCD